MLIKLQSGFLATTICFGVAALTMLALRFSLIWENRRRDELQRASAGLQDEQYQHEISDETDGRNLSFRYVY